MIMDDHNTKRRKTRNPVKVPENNAAEESVAQKRSKEIHVLPDGRVYVEMESSVSTSGRLQRRRRVRLTDD